MPYLDSEDKRIVYWDDEEIKTTFNGDTEFANNLTIAFFPLV